MIINPKNNKDWFNWFLFIGRDKANQIAPLFKTISSQIYSRDHGYYSVSLKRRGDFVYYFYDGIFMELYAVLTRGKEIPKSMLCDGWFTKYKDGECEVTMIYRGHSGGIMKEGPWWNDFITEEIPKFYTDYALHLEELSVKEREATYAKEQEYLLHQLKWNAK